MRNTLKVTLENTLEGSLENTMEDTLEDTLDDTREDTFEDTLDDNLGDTLVDIMGRLVVSSKQIRWHVSSLCVLQTLEDTSVLGCPPNFGGHVSSPGVLQT